MATFPGATADRAGAAYAVVGAPLDVTTSFRAGTRFGPDRVRQFARAFDDYDHVTGQEFSSLAVHDAGDITAWPDVPDYLEYLSGMLGDLHDEEVCPLVVGGEHTVSLAGVRATGPDVYVCLDAHLDLHETYAGERYAHATVTRRVLERVDEVVIIGARTGSKAEWDRASPADVTVVEPESVASWEPSFDDPIYVSVDIDAADPGFAPGTGTPEPFGLEPATIRDVVRRVAPSAVGFDVVEVTDGDDGQAAALGAKLLREFVYTHAAESE